MYAKVKVIDWDFSNHEYDESSGYSPRTRGFIRFKHNGHFFMIFLEDWEISSLLTTDSDYIMMDLSDDRIFQLGG